MSEITDRGAALRTVLADELPEAWNGLKWEQHEVGHYFRSICEHLGLRWIDVDHLNSVANEANAYYGPHTESLADALATLLEAAGIER